MSKATADGDPKAPVLPWQSAVLHLAAAAFVYYVDAFVMGQGIGICFVAVGAVIVGLIHVARGLSGDRMWICRGIIIAAIWSIAACCAVVTVADDRRGAKQRAEQVVGALRSYRKLNGTYPPSLQALVLEFLPAVPLARKHTMGVPGFRYAWDGSRGYLMYTSLPVITVFMLPQEEWASSDD